MPIDAKLNALVWDLKTKLAGMADARPSQILAVKEEFVLAWREVVKEALTGLSDAEKIAAFDALAAGVLELVTSPEKWVNKDSDADHYVFEDVVGAVFGDGVWRALNELGKLDLPSL